MEQITIASLHKPCGLKGEVHAFSMTDFPKERFVKGRKLYAVNPKTGASRTLTLRSVRIKGEALVLGFEEINSIEEAQTLLHLELNMDKAEATMPKDTFRVADIIGCVAKDDDGRVLGEVVAMTAFAPTKNLKIKKEDGKFFYVPFINQFVGTVDIENKEIQIHVIEGML